MRQQAISKGVRFSGCNEADIEKSLWALEALARGVDSPQSLSVKGLRNHADQCG